MPSRSSPDAVDLALDIQALRHLTTRREIANVLWSGNVRGALGATLRSIHGEKNFYDLERTVSKQLLLTRINLLPSLLERLYDQNNDHRAQYILRIVEEIIRANRDQSDSLQFEEDFVLLLLQAVLQASLQVLMKADGQDIRAIYRTTVDLLREIFESCEDSVPTLTLKKTGVKLVKDVVTALIKSDKKGALLKASKFLENYPYTRTANDLHAQANVLARELGPLVIRQNYVNSKRRAGRADHRLRARGKKRSHVRHDRPEFFSDGSDETSNVTPDDESYRNDPRDPARDVAVETFNSEVDSRSSADTPRPPKKRARMSREVVDDAANDSVGLENGDMQTDSETPVSRSRGRRYPHLDQELHDMDSPMFSETRPPPERVDHVVRHARSRGQKRTWRPKETRKRPLLRQRSPTSISQEGSSPTHRPKRSIDHGLDKDDEDRMGRMGREGAVLQDLRIKATKLLSAGPSDPLAEALRDARQSRRRKHQSDPSYSPGTDAREASPFPDSDDDSDMPRKKVSRIQLVQTPVGQRSKRRAQRAHVSRPAMHLFGKPCRVGRFEPFEDKLLLKGLQELGWGAWTEIAREFWEGDFTRAPSSLKDRARTLNLSPSAYPRRIELRGRPRLSDHPTNNAGPSIHEGGGKSGNSSDEDQDEDEEDPIEAPNGTPGSGNEDKGED